MRKTAWVVTIAMLLVTGVIGLTNTPEELRATRTTLQRFVSVSVVLYGILGVVGGAALALRRRWSVVVVAAWSVAVFCAATVASFAFSDPSFENGETVTGTIAAALATGLVGAFCVWAARSATRDQKLPPAARSNHIPSP